MAETLLTLIGWKAGIDGADWLAIEVEGSLDDNGYVPGIRCEVKASQLKTPATRGRKTDDSSSIQNEAHSSSSAPVVCGTRARAGRFSVGVGCLVGSVEVFMAVFP